MLRCGKARKSQPEATAIFGATVWLIVQSMPEKRPLGQWRLWSCRISHNLSRSRLDFRDRSWGNWMATTAKAARQDQDARRARRHKTSGTVALRKQGEHRVDTRLLDISRFGFRVEIHGLAPDSIVWLKLPDADPQMARVVWSDHLATGCVFVEILAADLFRRILREELRNSVLITGPWPAAVSTARR
ncbi:PilZ domain-containing protein [Sphingomonas koreensis]|nr:PilZ domain-containing protein [Sphingomonas koreensis]